MSVVRRVPQVSSSFTPWRPQVDERGGGAYGNVGPTKPGAGGLCVVTFPFGRCPTLHVESFVQRPSCVRQRYLRTTGPVAAGVSFFLFFPPWHLPSYPLRKTGTRGAPFLLRDDNVGIRLPGSTPVPQIVTPKVPPYLRAIIYENSARKAASFSAASSEIAL